MSNDCCGNLKCVAKNKETLDRILKILKYEDSEFCIHRCKDAQDSESYKDGDLWVKDIYVDGAWNCQQFFRCSDNPDDILIDGFEKDKDGNSIYEKPIYGTAHYTSLCHIAKVLDCGFELYSTEPGMGFWEHLTCNHNGELIIDETGDYELGEDDESFTIDGEDYDSFNEYMFTDEIYGKENT